MPDRLLINPGCKATGATQRYAYSAYGHPRFLTGFFADRLNSDYNWETMYCGYRYDTATSLIDVRHRVFHARVGGWVQRDPLEYSDTNSLYQYCRSRPVTLTDPFGLHTTQFECYDDALNELLTCEYLATSQFELDQCTSNFFGDMRTCNDIYDPDYDGDNHTPTPIPPIIPPIRLNPPLPPVSPPTVTVRPPVSTRLPPVAAAPPPPYLTVSIFMMFIPDYIMERCAPTRNELPGKIVVY